MLNSRAVCRNNNAIANDYYTSRLNSTEYTRSQQQVFMRKQDGANKTRERAIAKYESRRNMCDKCYTVKATLTGECLCD